MQLHSQVTSKWQKFGLAVGIAKEILDRYSQEECIVQVLDCWLRNHNMSGTKPTWRDVSKALEKIELHQLAESVLNVYETVTVRHFDIQCD